MGLNLDLGLVALGLCLLVGLIAVPLGLCHASFGLPRGEREVMGLGKVVDVACLVLHLALTCCDRGEAAKLDTSLISDASLRPSELDWYEAEWGVGMTVRVPPSKKQYQKSDWPITRDAETLGRTSARRTIRRTFCFCVHRRCVE